MASRIYTQEMDDSRSGLIQWDTRYLKSDILLKDLVSHIYSHVQTLKQDKVSYFIILINKQTYFIAATYNIH